MESRSIVVSFNDEQNSDCQLLIDLLSHYQTIICSCVGPINSKFKFISTKSDPISPILTNSSRHLTNALYRLEIENSEKSNEKKHGLIKWKLDLIKSTIVNAHFNQFYDSGLLLLYIINQLIIHENKFKLSRDVIDSILRTLCEKLNRDKNEIETSFILLKLDLENLKFLHTFLKTILFSNKLLADNLNDGIEKNNFINMCLKLHLNSFNQSVEGDRNEKTTYAFSKIIYLFNDSSSLSLKDSLVCNGILIKQDQYYTDSGFLEIIRENDVQQSNFKCILFDTNSLSGEFENFSDLKFKFQTELNNDQIDLNRTCSIMVQSLIEKCDHLIDKYRINLIFSQKVIHPSLKKHLKKRKVIAIERLSTVYAQPMMDLTNCKACHSISNVNDLDEKFFGHLKSVSIVQIYAQTYLHFEGCKETFNMHSNVQTMIVCAQNESFTEELEYLFNVVQYAFQRLVISGVAICGGPCFLTFCLCYLWNNLEEIMKKTETSLKRSFIVLHAKQLRQIFLPYITQLLEKDLADYSLDLNCGHLFEINSNKNCTCGLFSSFSTPEDSNSRIDLSDDFNINKIDFSKIFSSDCNNKIFKNNAKVVLIDCFDSKLNALNLTRDILGTLLNIGVFIYS